MAKKHLMSDGEDECGERRAILVIYPIAERLPNFDPDRLCEIGDGVIGGPNTLREITHHCGVQSVVDLLEGAVVARRRERRERRERRSALRIRAVVNRNHRRI